MTVGKVYSVYDKTICMCVYVYGYMCVYVYGYMCVYVHDKTMCINVTRKPESWETNIAVTCLSEFFCMHIYIVLNKS